MTSTILSVIFAVALATTSLFADTAPVPQRFQVAVVGDSLAYGAGDESGTGIAGRLDSELRSHGMSSGATMNLGENGASTLDLAAKLRQPATREAIARANAIVLSIGGNDLRFPVTGEQRVRSPFLIVSQILRNIDGIVAELHRINPGAHIIVLGAYSPIPHEKAAALLDPIIAVWDGMLMAQFADKPRVSVVRISDIIDRPERLSTLDSFHPGGEAYQETARRIAGLLAATSF